MFCDENGKNIEAVSMCLMLNAMNMYMDQEVKLHPF